MNPPATHIAPSSAPRTPRYLRAWWGRRHRGLWPWRSRTSPFDLLWGLEGEGHDAVAVAVGVGHALLPDDGLAFILSAIGVGEELDGEGAVLGALESPLDGGGPSSSFGGGYDGKFWRLLGPVSASPTPSLAVTPSPLKDRLRSMPTPALEKIELMDHLCNRLVISRNFSAKGPEPLQRVRTPA